MLAPFAGDTTGNAPLAAGKRPPGRCHDVSQSWTGAIRKGGMQRKDPALYRRLFPDVAVDLPYVWPASDRRRRVPIHDQG